MTFYVENEVDADFGFDIENLAKSVADTVLDMEGCSADRFTDRCTVFPKCEL